MIARGITTEATTTTPTMVTEIARKIGLVAMANNPALAPVAAETAPEVAPFPVAFKISFIKRNEENLSRCLTAS